MEHLAKRASQIGEFFSKVGNADSVGLVVVDSPAEAEFLVTLARNMYPGQAIFSAMAIQRGSTVEIGGVLPDQKGPLILIVRRAVVQHVKAHPVWGKKVIGTLGA